MTSTKACDAVVEQLAYELAAVSERAVGYRLLAMEAVHRLHEQHLELVRLRERHQRLIEEFRAYRAATIETPGRAA